MNPELNKTRPFPTAEEAYARSQKRQDPNRLTPPLHQTDVRQAEIEKEKARMGGTTIFASQPTS